MSATENKQLVERYLEALSGKDKPATLVNQYVSEADQELRQHIADMETSFPHYELLAEDLIAEGDKVVVRFTLRATHNGDFMGIPATGKEILLPAIIIYQVANGKIVEHWLRFDSATLMQQLGVGVPA